MIGDGVRKLVGLPPVSIGWWACARLDPVPLSPRTYPPIPPGTWTEQKTRDGLTDWLAWSSHLRSVLTVHEPSGLLVNPHTLEDLRRAGL